MEENNNLLDFLDQIQEEYFSEFCLCCIYDICNKSYSESVMVKNITNDQQIRLFINNILKNTHSAIVCCKYAENGCNEKFKFKEYKEHLKVCKYNTILCSSCNGIYISNELPYHNCIAREQHIN